jgi:RNA polymerase sigma factor (TIGR02999 family)
MPLSRLNHSSRNVTDLLVAWSHGKQEALNELVPLVYDELRRIARRRLQRERAGHTLQSAALVHEAYERLISIPNVRWQDRAHFFAVAAQLMRRILVDYARSRNYVKRGGAYQKVSLDEALSVTPNRSPDLVALDAALDVLARTDPRKGRIVELRYFGGLSVEETSEVLQISTDTVLRDWKLAKAWLLRELSHAGQPAGNATRRKQ